jgi:rhamnulose-1-phosphate aldolase/alcohol dehydrogenase
MGNLLQSRWEASRVPADPVEVLVYRSNLLGSDPRITNFGGGNTSAKLTMPDPLTGENVLVMWVKGSGGDLGTMKRAGLASLYLERVLALEKLGRPEDEIVGLYPHCTFNLNPTAASIDTPLHAFVPFAHVDHLHADAMIAIAASADAERLTEEIFGGELGYVPWKRPGFDLGLMMRDEIARKPGIRGIMMGSHGFISWADSNEACYENTLELINRAIAYLESRAGLPFGEAVSVSPTAPSFASFLPELRGAVTHDGVSLIAHVDTSSEVLDFLSRAEMPRLAAMGTSCPDHFLRTKIWPMVLTDATKIGDALADYRAQYAAYYERCKRPDSPAMRNPNPSVVLCPGLGMVTFGKTKHEAVVTAEFYRRAIEVMRGAESISRYTALPEQEAFDIEYWLLEEAKLKRMPPAREFAGKVALITGAAQGIGRATAIRLASEGACVVLCDLNAERLTEAVDEVCAAAGSVWNAEAIAGDVTTDLEAAFDCVVSRFGGVDIVVANAGNARRGTVAETTAEDYQFLSDLLMKAYFETLQRASQLMIRQGIGGSLIVVGSKNGVAVGSNAALYSAAKAFELHLMRTAAADLAKHGIRANAVNPDAVIQGSGIWSDAWREQTASSLGISVEELPEYYRKRSMLGRAVEPAHVAEAIAWLASERRSSRSTGVTIPVDGGVREAFLR